MIEKEKEGIRFLEFELFSEFSNLKHAIFLREGGFSKKCYHSLNLSYLVGDEEAIVKENEKKVRLIMGCERLVRGNLCHGKRIVDISSLDTKMLSDGIATKKGGFGLLSTHADCQTALFYDPIQKAIANIHAGYRGSVQNIYQETINFMKKTYGSNEKDLHVAISPSLGPMQAEFINYKKELPETFWEFETVPNHFDFWEISNRQLLNAGLLPHHIQIAKIDTFSNEKDYFSYRRDKITGRNASFIALK